MNLNAIVADPSHMVRLAAKEAGKYSLKLEACEDWGITDRFTAPDIIA